MDESESDWVSHTPIAKADIAAKLCVLCDVHAIGEETL